MRMVKIIKATAGYLSLWLPVLTWAVVIYAFSNYPIAETSQVYWKDFIVKKSAHIIEYAIFSLLNYRALKGLSFKKENAGLFAIFISLFYALTDELHQFFTPGRQPRVRDVVFDTIGAIAAIYFVWNLLPRVPEKLKNLAKRLQII